MVGSVFAIWSINKTWVNYKLHAAKIAGLPYVSMAEDRFGMKSK